MAVILAGGQGTRLKPLSTDLPKALVKIGDRPIIEYLLLRMKKNGIKQINLAVNHKAEMIENVLGDGERFGLDIKYSRESIPLSTVAPLKLIDNLDENFIVANGDILSDINFEELFKYHCQSSAGVTVATYKRTHNVDFGVLTTDENNKVVKFIEKPTFDYQVSMGIYVFSRSILEMVPENQAFGFDDLMFKMLEQGMEINSYLFDGFWLDIGRVEDYLIAQRDIKKIESLIL